MAKQSGSHTITGTIDNLCFYKMKGKYYVRMKSSLNSKRVKQDPAFAVTMQYAQMLGTASKIASGIYRRLNKAQKIKGSYKQLTGEVMRMLKRGEVAERVHARLAAYYLPEPTSKKKQPKRTTRHEATENFADAILSYIFAEEETVARGTYIQTKEAAPT